MSVYCKLCEIEMADTYCMECEGIGYGSLCSECDGDLHSIGSKTTHVRIPHEMKSMAVEAVAEVVASDDNPYVADSEVQREGNDDDEKTDPVCGICEEEKAVFACGECKSAAGIEHFCRECDSQFHVPSNLRSHSRVKIVDDDELDALAGLDGEFLLDALLEGFDVNNNNLPASTSNKHSTKASPRVSLPERRFSLGTFMQELETLDVDQEEDEGDLLLKSLQIEVAKSARGESEKEDENDPKYSSEKSRGTTMSENLELLASRKHAYDTNRAKLDMDSTNRDASLRASAFARASGLIERERAGSITSLVNNMLNTHQGAEKEKEKEANTHNNSKGFASSLGDIKEGIGSEAGSPNKLNDNDIDENASNSSLSARDGSMSNDETQRKMSVGSFMFELLAEFGDTVEGDTADTHVAARMDAADQKRREKEDSSKRKDSKEEKEEKEDIERMRKMSVSSSMSHFLDNDGKVEKQKEGDGDNKQEKKNARERLKDQEKGKKGGKVEEERKEREGVTKGGNDQEKLRKLSMNSFISHWTKESVDAETKTEEASQEKVNTDGTDPIESEEERMRKLSVTSFMSQWMDDSEEQEKKRRKKEEDKERASTEELKRTTKKEPERGRQQGEHIPEEEGEESGSERENKSAKESVDGEKSNCGNDPSLFLSSPPSSLLSPRAVAHKSQVARMGSRNSLLIQAALKSPMKERDRGRYGNRMAERFERTSKIDMSMRSTGDCSPGGVADDDSGCEDGNYNREKKNQLQTRHSGQFVPPLHHLDLSYIHLSPVQFTSPEKSARRASRLNPSDMSNTSDGANRSTSTSKSRSRSKSNNNDNHSIHNIDDSRTREHYTSNPPQIRSMSTPSSPALNRHNCSDRYSCKNSPSTVKEDGSDENTLSLPFSSAATVSRVKHPKLYRSGSQSTRNKYSSSSKHGHTLTREIKSARNMRSKSRDRAHGCRRKSTGRRRGAFQTPKRKGGLKTPRSTRSAKNGHRNRNKSSKGAKSLRTNHRNLQIHSARSSRRRDTSRHALRSVKSVRDRSRTPREPSSAKGRRGGAGLGRGKEKFKGSARAKKIQTPGKKNKSTADILKQPESALTIIKIDSHGPDSDDDVINTNKKMDSIQQEKRKHPHSNSKSGSRNLNTDQKDKKQGSQVRRRKRSAEENRRRTRKKKSASKRTSSSSGSNSNSKSDTDSVTDNASASASFSDSSFSSSVSDDDSEDSFSSDSGTTTASSSESDFPSIACRRRRGNSMHRKDDRYSSRSRRRSRHRNKGQHRSMSKYRKRRKSRHSSEKSRVAVDIYEKSTVETEPVVDAHVTMQKARLAEYVNTRYRKLLSQQRLGRHLPMDMDRLLEERIQQEVHILAELGWELVVDPVLAAFTFVPRRYTDHYIPASEAHTILPDFFAARSMLTSASPFASSSSASSSSSFSPPGPEHAHSGDITTFNHHSRSHSPFSPLPDHTYDFDVKYSGSTLPRHRHRYSNIDPFPPSSPLFANASSTHHEYPRPHPSRHCSRHYRLSGTTDRWDAQHSYRKHGEGREARKHKHKHKHMHKYKHSGSTTPERETKHIPFSSPNFSPRRHTHSHRHGSSRMSRMQILHQNQQDAKAFLESLKEVKNKWSEGSMKARRRASKKKKSTKSIRVSNNKKDRVSRKRRIRLVKSKKTGSGIRIDVNMKKLSQERRKRNNGTDTMVLCSSNSSWLG